MYSQLHLILGNFIKLLILIKICQSIFLFFVFSFTALFAWLDEHQLKIRETGYLNDAEATASTIDVDGWLHTVDIGYVDNDEEVFIVDRVKELIKFKGFQVPPAELEALLVSHLSIADAAVVPQKGEAAGEVPVALVVRANDFDLSEETVKEFIAKQVVLYKRLHRVISCMQSPNLPQERFAEKT